MKIFQQAMKEKEYKNAMGLFKTQKETFIYCGYFKDMTSRGEMKENKSPIAIGLVRNSIFDKNLIKKVFSFLEPKNPS